jgi:hypothetical protein
VRSLDRAHVRGNRALELGFAVGGKCEATSIDMAPA